MSYSGREIIVSAAPVCPAHVPKSIVAALSQTSELILEDFRHKVKLTRPDLGCQVPLLITASSHFSRQREPPFSGRSQNEQRRGNQHRVRHREARLLRFVTTASN